MIIKALVLAGGRGVRFGGDKALAALGGRPLIGHVIEGLRGQSLQPAEIAISANGDAGRFAGFGLPVLQDGEFAGLGPLAGLAAGLAWAGDAEVLVTAACDVPVLPGDLVARLLPAPAFARAGGRDHYLAAAWPVSALPALLAQLRAGGSVKVERFARLLGARAVEFDDADGMFANINRREELAALAAAGCGNRLPHH